MQTVACVSMVDSTPTRFPIKYHRFEPLRKEDDPQPFSTNQTSSLDLKPLPSSLRYAFLDSQSKFPFIINSDLPANAIDALQKILNKH